MRYYKVGDYSKERTTEVMQMVNSNRMINGKLPLELAVIADTLGYTLVCHDIDSIELETELRYIFQLD